jgi:hypothetical protein
MTVTETSPIRNGRVSTDGASPAFADQIVLSGAGLASQGISNARRVLDGVVGAVDTMVLGSLDIAEQVAQSSLLSDLSTKGIEVARASWSTAVGTYREAIAVL